MPRNDIIALINLLKKYLRVRNKKEINMISLWNKKCAAN